MNWKHLAVSLFGGDHGLHGIDQDGDFLHGTVVFDGMMLTVIGTTGHAPIGVNLALRQARAVLDTIVQHPGRAILLLIDTQGQQLRRRDELLGINRAMAHLGMCIDLARRRGHRVIGLVYDQALSGGFITSGLIADACYALPQAEIRVMRLPAMAASPSWLPNCWRSCRTTTRCSRRVSRTTGRWAACATSGRAIWQLPCVRH
jgi:malonate decarboxylase gamma subunit